MNYQLGTYQVRKHNGRFDSFKRKARRALITFAVLGSLITLAFDFGMNYSASTVQAVTPEVIDMTPAKIEALKADLVSRIAVCESAGHSEADGIIVFDSNNQASIGQLQWQRKSVQFYEKKLYGKDVSAKEAVLIALDTTAASALAQDVIFKADGLGNWLNCANQLGLRADVNAINRLSK